MTKLWVDPPEGWKYGFPAIYDSETDGQISDWAVRKGYPLLTIKEYGEQWHVRCWPAEEPEECPDQDINTQEQPKAVENDPIGARMRKTTREEKIIRPGVYEVPTEAVLEMRDYISVLEKLVRELGDRLAKLEKTEQEPVAYLSNKRQRLNIELKPQTFVDVPTVTDWEIPLFTAPQPKQDEVDIRSRLYQRIHELEAVLKDIAEYTGEGPSTTDWQGIVKLISDSARNALEADPRPYGGASFRYGDHPTSFGLTKRTWVGLTDEEILKFQDIVPNTLGYDLIQFAKAIEAKLKEKNNG